MFSFGSWLIAKVYDCRFFRRADARYFSGWRSELLEGVSGAVLEVGAGTGFNYQYYPDGVSRLVLTEPNPYMFDILCKRVKQRDFQVETYRVRAEETGFDDESFDFVVGTFVLCSVFEPFEVLSEISRVLKPGGKFLFVEHAANTGNERAYKWQRRIEPVWKRVAGNCHITRETKFEIEAAGFEIAEYREEYKSELPGIINPFIRGIGRKTK